MENERLRGVTTAVCGSSEAGVDRHLIYSLGLALGRREVILDCGSALNSSAQDLEDNEVAGQNDE